MDLSTITCKDIVAAMPGRFQPAGAGAWGAVVQFKFSGPRGGNFYVTVKDKTCIMTEGDAPRATATVTTKDETWINMCLGKLDPQTAFMSGQIQIAGNMADIMQINNPKIFTRQQLGAPQGAPAQPSAAGR